MTQTTYQPELTIIRGMCNIPPEMSSFGLVKRIEAIALVADGALCNTAQDTPEPSKPATMPQNGAIATFWGSLKPDYQAYLLSVFTTVGKSKYHPDDIEVGPSNIGPVHKAISHAEKKARVSILCSEGNNGNRRWYLTEGFHAFMEQEQAALV